MKLPESGPQAGYVFLCLFGPSPYAAVALAVPVLVVRSSLGTARKVLFAALRH